MLRYVQFALIFSEIFVDVIPVQAAKYSKNQSKLMNHLCTSGHACGNTQKYPLSFF